MKKIPLSEQLTIQQAISRAKKATKKGKIADAVELYTAVLEHQPNHPIAKKALGKLQKGLPQNQSLGTDASSPSQDQINSLVNLYQSGQMTKTEQACRELLKTYPQALIVTNVLGVALCSQGKLQEAVQVYDRAIQLNPDYAEAHSNLGVALQELGKLEDAEASYRKAIALKPDYADAHSNLGVTLQELGKLEGALVQYKKSFELVRGKNPVDPQHKSFRLISKAKMEHDIEQFEYLAASGYESEKFQALVNVYKAVSSEINWPTNDAAIIPLTDKYQKRLMDTYNRSIHLLEAPELPGPTLSNTLDIEKITENYFKHDFGLTYFDNFLTAVALDSIRQFLLGSTIWFDFFHRGGYMGAYLQDGLACPLFLQIAEEMRTTFPKIFKNHPLKQLWAYKYDSRAYKNDSSFRGINAHADFAAVNVNFWVTPKEANLNSSSGGLVVYNKEAPLEWDFKTFNSNQEKILEHLEDKTGEKSIVPYNENRIVIFNSNLIHETDKFEFKEGYENRRINITMLFGDRK